MCGLYLKYGAASYSQALHLTVCELEVIGGDLAVLRELKKISWKYS